MDPFGVDDLRGESDGASLRAGRQSFSRQDSIFQALFADLTDSPRQPLDPPPRAVRKDRPAGALVQSLTGEDVYGASIAAFLSIGELVGKGSFGKVYRATENGNGDQVAVKIIPKFEGAGSKSLAEKFGLELLLIALTYSHPNVIQFRRFFEDPANIYVVSELYTGPSLFAYLAKRAPLGEEEGKRIVKQILQALAFLHALDAMHRDVKPDNFLFETAECRNLRMVDFGCCVSTRTPPTSKGRESGSPGHTFASVSTRATRSGESVDHRSSASTQEPTEAADSLVLPAPASVKPAQLRTLCGAIGFCAPELSTGVYDRKCDMFSCGVMAFILLTNKWPFPSCSPSACREDFEEYHARVQQASMDSARAGCAHLSEAAREFLLPLLDLTDPSVRPEAEDALVHKWFSETLDTWTQFG